jgi:hypothetical protein
MSWTVPENATEEWYGRLPFHLAQAEFGAGSPDPSTAILAQLGWHSTFTDPNRGSFAVVRRDGPLHDYLGERIKVTVFPRSVYAYVVARRDIAEEISLTRPLFGRVALLAETSVENAKVEVVLP